jgi:hypothetical protein
MLLFQCTWPQVKEHCGFLVNSTALEVVLLIGLCASAAAAYDSVQGVALDCKSPADVYIHNATSKRTSSLF